MMKESNDINQKRALLLTVRLRFSPQIQPAKQVAMNRMVEQILSLADETRGLSLGEIQSAFASQSGGYILKFPDIRDSMTRLVDQGRAEQVPRKGKKRRYRLSEQASPEMEEVQREASKRVTRVVSRLFKNAKQQPSIYIAPFLECISRIFSQLGEEYVRVIKGEISSEHFLAFPLIPSTIRQIRKDYDFVEYPLFENAVASFFRDPDPENDLIKWNIGQNYFLIKALGLDPDLLVLFRDTFGEGTFYMDTNLLITVLAADEYYTDFLALNKACKRLGINLKVLQITLDELQTWVETQRGVMEKVIDEIPDGMEQKVRSPFYHVYKEKERSGETFGFDEVFAGFDFPRQHLEEVFQVEFQDDPWFEEARGYPEIAAFSESLRRRYSDIRRRSKTETAALHDALVLSWIQRLREDSNGNIWLITADTSLPGALPARSNAHSRSLAITSDAFLQWVSPMCIEENGEEDFAAVFAQMIKRRVLPQERVFDLEDFLVFHELNMSCKELPTKDVESCIRHIKENASTLNPLNPKDREKLASEVSKFFASPGREYKMEVARLEATLQTSTEEFEAMLKERDRRIQELEEESLRRSAHLRLGVTVFVFVILEVVGVFLAGYYGSGANLFQKVLSFWQLLCVPPPVTIVVGWFLIGRERLGVLGWPFTSIFKQQ